MQAALPITSECMPNTLKNQGEFGMVWIIMEIHLEKNK